MSKALLKFQKILCMCVVLITLSVPFSSFAATSRHKLEYNDIIYYMNEDGTWSMDGWRQKADSLSIPYSIDGIPVTSIERDSKTGMRSCRSLTIPGSISVIAARAFISCDIEELYISEGVTQIESGAFYWNPLKEVTLPTSLTHIGDQVFNYLNGDPIKGLVFQVVKGSYAESHVKQNYPYAKIISTAQSSKDNSIASSHYSPPSSALTSEKYSRYGVKLKGAEIYWVEKADLDRGMNAWSATRSTYRAVSKFKFSELLNTHCLYSKTDFTYTQSTPDHFFTEECILRSPSGKVARYQGQNFLEGKERNWNWYWYNPLGDLIQTMYGQAVPAETGIYTFELYFDGQLVGTASFSIID